MPLPTQQQVTQYGRRIKPRFAEMVLAAAPYGPQVEERQEHQKYLEQMAGISQQNQDLLDRIQSQNAEDRRRANRLGFANLGMKALGDYLEGRGTEEILFGDGSPATSGKLATPAARTGTPAATGPEFDFTGMGGEAVAADAAQPGFLRNVGRGASMVWDKLTTGPTLTAGTIGGAAGQLTSGSKGEKAIVGAGVGAASNWLLSGGAKKLFNEGTFGGDWMSSALSGLMGGAFSFI